MISLVKYKKRIIFLMIAAVGIGYLIHDYKPVKWWEADRSSVGLAPLPSVEKQAVVQVYAARTINWKGYFAVHTWVATKEKNANHYLTYQVMGYRVFRGGEAVLIREDIPDRRWFGAQPILVEELRGEKAEKAIPEIKKLATNYTYNHFYQLWPGPNSNTFVSHIIRYVPELTVELPPNAIGKDWIDDGRFFALSESGKGVQFSIYGVLGITLGLAEGIEVNILGLTFGIDFYRPALKLPFVGRIGYPDKPL